MPPVPKPKRKSKAARQRTRQRDKPWLKPECAINGTRLPLPVIALGQGLEDDHPGYAVQKMRAVRFSAHGLRLESDEWGACYVCGTHIKRGVVPQAHHGIVKKGQGHRIDEWWNLFPLCCEECHRRLESRELFDRLIQDYYLRISKYYLMDAEPSAERGREWLDKQLTNWHTQNQVKQSFYLPPVQGDVQ